MRASLFVTCLADLFFPSVGEATARLLRYLGVKVDFPAGQTCCGQPAWNAGHPEEARAVARTFLQAFARSEYVVTPSGSCAAMVRYAYPQLFAGMPQAAMARAIGAHVFELSEFIAIVLGITDLGARFPARATYHSSCHMTRELGVTEAPLRLLRQVRELELVDLPRADLCCGFGGAFAVRQPAISTAMADEKIGHVAATGARVLVGSDSGCLMHLAGRLERLGMDLQVMHLAELLWEGVRQA